MFSSMAWAQAAASTPAAGGPNWFESLFPFIAMFFIVYMFVIRPNQKRAEGLRSFQTGLKRGDSVLTNSGIMGTIEGLTDHFVTLQIATGVKIKVLKSAITSGVNDELEK